MVPANKIVANTLGDPDAEQMELTGYVSKKNTKGFFQSRYFVTAGRKLSYWTDEAAYKEEQTRLQNGDKDDSSYATEYDIVAMKKIEIAPDRILHLRFSNDKFKLDLQFTSETERSEWTSLLLAKKNLHSVQELQRELRDNQAVILTPTFQNLLVLEEDEKDEWMECRIDDMFSFEDTYSNNTSVMTGDLRAGEAEVSGTVQVLKAARAGIDELIMLCEDCLIEMGSRHPRVGVHCKSYVQRFASALKGRCLLELQVLLLDGTEGSHGSGMCGRLSTLGTESLCSAICFMSSVERLRKYPFMPHHYVQSYHDNLFSTGELISSYLSVAIERVEVWFRNLAKLSRQQKGSRYGKFSVVLDEILHGVQLEKRDKKLQAQLMERLATTLLLTYADQIRVVDITDWDQQCLVDFVQGLHVNAASLRDGYIHWDTENVNANANTAVAAQLPVSSHAADAFSCACSEVASAAILKIVVQFEATLDSFSAPLFDHKVAENWEGDQAVALLVSHIGQWAVHQGKALPAKMCLLVHRRAARLALRTYIHEAARAYKLHKNFALQNSGIVQTERDLQALERFIRTCVSGVNVGQICDDEEHPELALLGYFRKALQCTTASAAVEFAKAAVTFGSRYGLHLYDFFRLVLKLRGSTARTQLEVSSVQRRVLLGECSEVLHALEAATATDQGLLLGMECHDVPHLLDYICPQIGNLHLTGSRWSVEKPPHGTHAGTIVTVQSAVMEGVELARTLREQRQERTRRTQIAARSRVKRREDESTASTDAVADSTSPAASVKSSGGTALPPSLERAVSSPEMPFTSDNDTDGVGDFHVPKIDLSATAPSAMRLTQPSSAYGSSSTSESKKSMGRVLKRRDGDDSTPSSVTSFGEDDNIESGSDSAKNNAPPLYPPPRLPVSAPLSRTNSGNLFDSSSSGKLGNGTTSMKSGNSTPTDIHSNTPSVSVKVVSQGNKKVHRRQETSAIGDPDGPPPAYSVAVLDTEDNTKAYQEAQSKISVLSERTQAKIAGLQVDLDAHNKTEESRRRPAPPPRVAEPVAEPVPEPVLEPVRVDNRSVSPVVSSIKSISATKEKEVESVQVKPTKPAKPAKPPRAGSPAPQPNTLDQAQSSELDSSDTKAFRLLLHRAQRNLAESRALP